MSSSSENCAIDGDDNLYGLGVRLGQYFLWFALVAAYLHKQSKMVRILSTGTLLLGLVANYLLPASHHDKSYNISTCTYSDHDMEGHRQ